ncbi:WXG100 family type VII secretion target [Nocardia wallacei]|uniref:WXG100 family type VII secretion target n=1 Tax=Nocardia wallacei TaxID=480035 RepID=UPI0024590542|nr:WXG100 family type VII secretion target [Nocardia wallacei]
MGSDFRVDLVGMQSLVDKAADLEKRIDDRLRDIETRVAGLHIDWTGQAAEAHRTATTEWATGAAEMNTALGELRAALEHARSVYQQAGQTNVGMWPT